MKMTFEQLQQEWNKMEFPKRSHEELMRMTRASHIPRLRRMKMRLIGECAFMVVFITSFILVADLLSGPLWLTIAFITCNALYLFNDFLSYRYLRILPQISSIRLSMIKFSQRMKWLVAISRIANLLMSSVVITILVTRMKLSVENMIVWAFMFPLLIIMTWRGSRNWSRSVRDIRVMLNDMKDA